MINWIIDNGGMIAIIALYLVGYVIIKSFIKKILTSRSKKRPQSNN